MAEVWVVTGGIGSGKSTISNALAQLGAIAIDADAVGHAVLAPDGAAHEAVARRWPSVVSAGRIDRRALAEIVFTDEAALRELEAITHPAIGAEILRQVHDAGDAVVAVEISVPRDLIGAGWLRTIVADLPLDVRRQRLIDRGMSEEDVDLRVSNQPSRDAWRARGRWVIPTDGTREDVSQRVERLWATVIAAGR
jgi:dephospho-CoA kinase